MKKKLNISIPVSINEEILLFHYKNNDYYNDQCNVYTKEKRTDIILYEENLIIKIYIYEKKNCDY